MPELSILKTSPSEPTELDYCQAALDIAQMNSNRIAKIQHLLVHLGVPTHLRGYWYLIWMLDQALTGTIKLEYATKLLYPETAAHFGVKTCVVERNVRLLLRWTWQHGDPSHLASFLGRYTDSPPSNTMFMRIFMNHINYQEYGILVA